MPILSGRPARLHILRCLPVLLAVFATACAGAGGETPRSAAAFALQVLPASYLDGVPTGTFSLHEAAAEAELVVNIEVADAVALKALYFELSYDATQYTPVGVRATGALGATAAAAPALLELGRLDTPGLVISGQVLVHPPEQAGFSGTATLAEVRFARRAFSSARQASTPPISAASRATLRNIGPGQLAWRFASQGDYDQNGEVNIADLTPLGTHFNTIVVDPTSAQSVCDGDNNTEVNISDLTPIGANFSRSLLGGWNIYASGDPGQYPAAASAGNGTAVLLGNVGVDAYDGSTTRTVDRVYYTYTIAAPVAGDSYWVRPVDPSAVEGIASTLYNFSSAPIAPTVVLNADVTMGAAPLTVTFTAVVTDPDSLAFTYEFDLDGDGTFETVTGASNMTSTTYSTNGTFLPVVKVKDDTSLQAFGSRSISVGATGNQPAVPYFTIAPSVTLIAPVEITITNLSSDPEGDALTYAWNVDGDPEPEDTTAAPPPNTYMNGGTFDITLTLTDAGSGTPQVYTRSVFIESVGSFDLQTLDAEDESGLNPSIAMVGGKPGIAYKHVGGANPLRYIGSIDQFGASWGTAGPAPGSSPGWVSLADAGGPAIATYELGLVIPLLAYTRYDSGSLAWGTPAQIDATFDAGNYCSLAIINGNPAIAYVQNDGVTSNLLYIRSTDALGTAWPALSVNLSAGTLATDLRYCSLAQIDGHPHLAYYRGDIGDLLIVNSTDVDGAEGSWSTSIAFAPSGQDVGQYCSLADIGGYPALAFYNATTQFVQYCRATVPAGYGWPSGATLVSLNQAAGYLSLASIAGQPAVCLTLSSGELEYHRCSNLDGTGIWDDQTPDPAPGATLTWCSMTEVGGNRAGIAYYDSTNKDLKFARNIP